PGVKVTLETYWWNPDKDGGAGWEQLVDPATKKPVLQTQITSASGLYLFRDVPTYVADPLGKQPDLDEDQKNKYLAGYRLRIAEGDLANLTTDWGVTLRNADVGEENDSDLSTAPVADTADGESYWMN